jgi:predicted HicB family RNase H-like nuclease
MVVKKRKQMCFDIDPQILIEIKVIAARRNISKNLWVHRALVAALKKEREYNKNGDLLPM